MEISDKFGHDFGLEKIGNGEECDVLTHPWEQGGIDFLLLPTVRVECEL